MSLANFGLSYGACVEMMGGYEPVFSDYDLIPKYAYDKRDECLESLNALTTEEIKRIEQACGYATVFHRILEEDTVRHMTLLAGYVPQEFCEIDAKCDHLRNAAWYIDDAPQWVRDATGCGPEDFVEAYEDEDEDEDEEETAA
jgi:hypothetical protein